MDQYFLQPPSGFSRLGAHSRMCAFLHILSRILGPPLSSLLFGSPHRFLSTIKPKRMEDIMTIIQFSNKSYQIFIFF